MEAALEGTLNCQAFETPWDMQVTGIGMPLFEQLVAGQVHSNHGDLEA